MKAFAKLTRGLSAVFASMFVAMVMSGGHALATIPYSGDTTPASPTPAFNVFTGVPSEGNESDFFRGKVAGDTNPSVNDVKTTCATGTRLTLRVYVHNGANENQNNDGTGPSVAKDTKVKVDLKNAAAAAGFSPTANISSSNAGSVNDGMTITCTDGKVVNLNYITGSATQFTSAGTKALSDTIVTTGAPIGTVNPDGNVWGCWTQRVYVTFTVEVKEVPPAPVPTNAVCKVEDKDFIVSEDRKVKVTVNATLQNASVLGYEINWGDGSVVSTKQSDTHTYAKDGTFVIKSRVQVKLADGTTKWVDGGSCTRTVTFKAGQPPVVPPVTPETPVTPATELPNTGAGNVIGLFTGVSAFGAAAHQFVTRRRASRI